MNRINEMIEHLIEQRISDMLNSIGARPTNPETHAERKGQTIAAVRQAYAQQETEPIKRRRRTRAAKKTYVIVKKWNKPSLELRPNDADVYNFLVSHPNASARQIATAGVPASTAPASRLKAVESSLWFLRNHDRDGKRLGKRQANTDAALVNAIER